MAVNSFFKTSNVAALATEQNLYSDLIKEAIQIYGHDVYYIDRTTVAIDSVLGEDSLSKFETQHPIEMYVEDSSGGFAGDKELITQFGLENRNEITFVVNKKRFQEMDSQVTIEDGTDTTGGSILLESGSIDQSGNSTTLTTVSGSESFYILQDTTSTDADRPQEGDLVYHPIIKRIFEVNFVDHDEPFYQLDNNPVYKLRCSQFEYSQEAVDTGITEIDEIEGTTANALLYQFTLEQSSTVNENIRLESGVVSDDTLNVTSAGLLLEETAGDNMLMENDDTSVGESILLEGGGSDSEDASYLIQEEYIVGDYSTDKTAQNELFDSLDDNVLDFSESNPFGDAGST
tara:strand:- start:447 stop:1484 length:1038 start_codon:yes stop_codon:yes gene_type:complete